MICPPTVTGDQSKKLYTKRKFSLQIKRFNYFQKCLIFMLIVSATLLGVETLKYPPFHGNFFKQTLWFFILVSALS